MVIDEDTISRLIQEAKKAGLIISGMSAALLAEFLVANLNPDEDIADQWKMIIEAEQACTRNRARFMDSYDLELEHIAKQMKELRERCPHTKTITMESTCNQTDTFCEACKGDVK